jgi:heme A synthase
MVLFRRLSIASTVATFILVSIGGLVRATKSGLGCGTDWPHCNGALTPVLENRAAIIEFSHRLAAAVVVVLVGALAVLAVRHRRRSPRIMGAALGAFGVVLFQAALGAIVVKLELEAASVVLHLATALTLAGLLLYVVASVHVAEGRLARVADAALSKRARIVAASVLALLLVGSYVGSYPDRPPSWPLIDQRLVPDLGNEIFLVHFLHRSLALLVGVLVIAFCIGVIRRKGDLPHAAQLAHGALGLFALEILLGALNVWTGLNPAVVTLHLIAGTLVWASLVALALVTDPGLGRTLQHDQLRRSAPVLEPHA